MSKFSNTNGLQIASSITLLASALLIAVPTIADTSEVDTRIVGGQAINLTVAPATVALLNASTYNNTNGNAGIAQNCGGTLIAEQWVLTAAHCVVSNTGIVTAAANILVLAGSADVTAPITQPVEVMSVTPHPEYVDSKFGSDLALLRLATSTGQPIAQLNTIPIELDDEGVTAGWGALNEGSDTEQQQFPANLQAVSVRMLPYDRCDEFYPLQSGATGVNVSPDQICAGRPGGGFDSCQGDSGGPLYRLTEAGVAGELVGVVSFGVGCARPDYPGVYAGVRTQAAFINGTINAPVIPAENPPPVVTDPVVTGPVVTEPVVTDPVIISQPTPAGPISSLTSSGGGSGGCTVGGGSGQRDPLLPLLLLVSFLFVFRKLLAPATRRRTSKLVLTDAS